MGEALVATAAGLATAIPAVLAYNAFLRSGRKLMAEMDAFAHDLHAYLTTGASLAAARSRVAPGRGRRAKRSGAMSFGAFQRGSPRAHGGDSDDAAGGRDAGAAGRLHRHGAGAHPRGHTICPRPPVSVIRKNRNTSRFPWMGPAAFIGTERRGRSRAAGVRAGQRQSASRELQLRADRMTPYHRVAEVLSAAASRAGVSRVGFVTEPTRRWSRDQVWRRCRRMPPQSAGETVRATAALRQQPATVWRRAIAAHRACRRSVLIAPDEQRQAAPDQVVFCNPMSAVASQQASRLVYAASNFFFFGEPRCTQANPFQADLRALA